MTPEPPEDDALEAELRGFSPLGAPNSAHERLRDRVLGREPGPPAEGLEEFEAQLAGFACEAPPVGLRERVMATVEALESRAESRRAILLYLGALLLLVGVAAAVNGAIAGITRSAFRVQQPSKPPVSEAEPSLRVPSATAGLRRRAQQHLNSSQRKG